MWFEIFARQLSFERVYNLFGYSAWGVVATGILASLAVHRQSAEIALDRRARISLGLFFLWVAFASVMTALRAPAAILGDLKLVELLATLLLAFAAAKIFRASNSIPYVPVLGAVLTVSALATALLFLGMMTSLYPVVQEGYVLGLTNIRTAGMTFSISILCGIGLLAATDLKQRKTQALLLLILTAGCWTALLWTGSRGGVLAILAAVVVVAILGRSGWRYLVSTAVSFVLGSALLRALDPPSVSEAITRHLDDISDLNKLSSNRLDYWLNDWLPIALERPFFGQGYSQLQFHLTKDVYQHTHNMILETFLATGFVGVVLLGTSLTLVLWRLLVGMRRATTALELGPYAVVFSLYVYALVDAPWYFEESLLPAALVCGLLLARKPGQTHP